MNSPHPARTRSTLLRSVTREPSAAVARVANGFVRPCQSWLGLEELAARREVDQLARLERALQAVAPRAVERQLGHAERVAVEREPHPARHGVVLAVLHPYRHHAAVTEADVDEPALAVEVDDERAVVERRPPPVGAEHLARHVVARRTRPRASSHPKAPLSSKHHPPRRRSTSLGSDHSRSVVTPRRWNTSRFSNGTVSRCASCSSRRRARSGRRSLSSTPIRCRYCAAETIVTRR